MGLARIPAVRSALQYKPGALTNLLSHSSVHSPLGEHCIESLQRKKEENRVGRVVKRKSGRGRTKGKL